MDYEDDPVLLLSAEGFGQDGGPLYRLSGSFCEAVHDFARVLSTGQHPLMEGVDYLDVYGHEASAIEQVFAVYVNVLRMDKSGIVLNADYADQRALKWLRFYFRDSFDPPFTADLDYQGWEVELYCPAAT